MPAPRAAARSRRAVLRSLVLPVAAIASQAHAQTSAPRADADATTLPAIEVVGRQTSGAYLADEVAGTKTELPQHELPQAVRSISRQTLDDLGATRLDDALDYVGGVSRQNSFGGLWDNISIRGFAGDVNTGMPLLMNGFAANRGFNAPRDTANVERIEFLKGPAASLYGTSEPGGTLNIVTKRPLWRAGHAIEGYLGSFNTSRLAIDSTAPLSENFAYRLNAAFEDRESFRDFITSQRAFVAPAFTWRIGRATRLDYNGELLRHKAPLDRGVVAIRNTLGDVPRNRFLGEPADGNILIENQTHQLVLEHDWSARWTSRAGLAYKSGSLRGFSTEAQPTLQPDERTLRRQRRFRDYNSDDLTFLAETTGRFVTGNVRHEVLVGAETYRFEVDQLMLRVNPSAGAPYAIDVFNPVYGQPQPTPLPNTDTNEVQRNVALYGQYVASLGASWRVVAGVRHDNFEQVLLNRRTGVRTEQSPSATSPRLGVSYLLTRQWTLFASGGTSFRPNAGVDAASSAFAPEEGRAGETGIKWESADRTFGGTLAYYDIRKKNVLTADPANAGFSIAAGEVRSQGVDLDLAGRIARNWRVNASFSYIDAKVTADNSLEVGGRLLNIPRTNASTLLVYENAAPVGRFGIGGGFTYSSKRLGEARTQAQANAGTPAFELPAYTVAKAVAYWRVSPRLRFSLDIDNVFDKTYYTQSFQRTWVAPGAPRTFMFGVQAKL